MNAPGGTTTINRLYSEAKKHRDGLLRKLPNYAIIIRCIHERGSDQEAAMRELSRRGLWLSPEQKRQSEETK